MNEFDRTQAMRQRTKDFAKTVIRLFAGMNKTREEIRILGRQVLRSGTSVGANYREASRARSNAEFIAKIEICTQEADETQYWLELLEEECAVDASRTQPLWKEADELIRIFVTMSKNTKSKNQPELRSQVSGLNPQKTHSALKSQPSALRS